jgi:hypothetical protein
MRFTHTGIIIGSTLNLPAMLSSTNGLLPAENTFKLLCWEMSNQGLGLELFSALTLVLKLSALSTLRIRLGGLEGSNQRLGIKLVRSHTALTLKLSALSALGTLRHGLKLGENEQNQRLGIKLGGLEHNQRLGLKLVSSLIVLTPRLDLSALSALTLGLKISGLECHQRLGGCKLVSSLVSLPKKSTYIQKPMYTSLASLSEGKFKPP